MGKRISARIEKAAEPVLEEGESIEVGTVGTITRASAKRRVATSAAVAAATTIATGGMVTAWTHAAKVPIVLTNKRLIVLGQGGFTGRAKSEVVAQVPRAGLHAKPARSLLWLSFDLFGPDGNQFGRMSFPLPNRAAGRQIASSLGEPPQPAASLA